MDANNFGVSKMDRASSPFLFEPRQPWFTTENKKEKRKSKANTQYDAPINFHINIAIDDGNKPDVHFSVTFHTNGFKDYL